MAKTITHQDLKSLWGNEDHVQVSQNRSFASMIFELLSEKVPSEEEEQIFTLILNLSIDHGSETPSAIKVIEAAKAGKTISESVAAGINEINDIHGGAAEPLMDIIYEIKKGGVTASQLVKEYREQDKRIPGFGHRIYKESDPRAKLLLNELQTNLGGEEFIAIARDLEAELALQTGKTLPINIDGAIAVVLCTLGWEPRLGKAVFIVARTPGLIGQYFSSIT